ncbi:response regulator transcription factor [Brevibacillus sp. SYP-B805]|uniref:response regulator n=1 Tax=Brevibacillus sp. SYP-B805 TaxID=1578199 RepID=UPI0013EDEE31|nr:response regulator transcription factor [Brevibacillus sp. SYP-B805]NGQ96168.1 response regulator transcription factor [Brevibacillus sp. SYP-B805]
MEQIRVMVVEDDRDWRKGLVDYVDKEADLTVVAAAETKEEAIRLFQQHDIDVVLLDINLTENNLDGIEIALELSERKEDCAIIMLTSLTAQEVIIDSFSAGAVNYLNKQHFQEIPDAIRAAYRRQSAIHPSAAAVLRQELQRLKQEEDKKLLSPAEKEILQLIHEGHTQSQIEKVLHITHRTIKNHINRILKKMGAKSSKEAAAKAKQKRLF